jgi:hypothetical protein
MSASGRTDSGSRRMRSTASNPARGSAARADCARAHPSGFDRAADRATSGRSRSARSWVTRSRALANTNGGRPAAPAAFSCPPSIPSDFRSASVSGSPNLAGSKSSCRLVSNSGSISRSSGIGCRPLSSPFARASSSCRASHSRARASSERVVSARSDRPFFASRSRSVWGSASGRWREPCSSWASWSIDRPPFLNVPSGMPYCAASFGRPK